MSILINGMEMPTSCIACLLNFGEKRPEYGLTIYCPYSDGVISWRDKAFDNGRLTSCGIVPVPPHGDLIDRDELIENCMKEDSFLAELLFRKVSNAPTIIEAEEGET